MTAFAAIQQLASITRYSKDALVNKESVLEHTGFVCLFSYLIAEHLNKPYVDRGKLLVRAVVHDLDEIFVGDIPRITKYATSAMAEEFRKLENVAIKRLMGILRLPTVNLGIAWATAKSDDIEGVIIRTADMAAVAYKVWQEAEVSGNNAVVRIAFELYQAVIPAYGKLIKMSALCSADQDFFLSLADNLSRLVQGAYQKCEDRMTTVGVRALIEFNMKE